MSELVWLEWVALCCCWCGEASWKQKLRGLRRSEGKDDAARDRRVDHSGALKRVSRSDAVIGRGVDEMVT